MLGQLLPVKAVSLLKQYENANCKATWKKAQKNSNYDFQNNLLWFYSCMIFFNVPV